MCHDHVNKCFQINWNVNKYKFTNKSLAIPGISLRVSKFQMKKKTVDTLLQTTASSDQMGH